MAGQYRISRSRSILLGVFFALVSGVAATAIAATATAAAPDDPLYTIEGVHVDVTAESAVAARAKAFDEAQQKAFTQLAQRLLDESQAASLTPPPPMQIATLVNDFEITQEQLSRVRYVGTYTFRFRPSAVRRYLSARNLSYSAVSSEPVLMLPFMRSGTRTMIWSDTNPWLDAWRKGGHGGLVPFALPLGDARDFADIRDEQALDFDPAAIQSMAARYGATTSAIAIATPLFSPNAADPSLPSGLEVSLYRTDRPSAEPVRSVTIIASDLKPGETVYDAGVRVTRDMLTRDWKNRAPRPQPIPQLQSEMPYQPPAAATGLPANSSLTARVRFRGAREWMQTQAAIRRAPGVTNVRLLSLRPQEATVSIDYRGNPATLRNGLASAGISYTGGVASYDTNGAYSASAGRPVANGGNLPELSLSGARSAYP